MKNPRELEIDSLPFTLIGEGPQSQVAPLLQGHVLTLTADAGADMFLDPAGSAGTSDAERFVSPVKGDFRRGTTRVVSVVTRDGKSDDCDSWPIDRAGTYLRISRLGPAFALHASVDGEHWNMVRYFGMRDSAPESVKIGFVAQSPSGEGTTATFSHIAFDAKTLTQVRDGS